MIQGAKEPWGHLVRKYIKHGTARPGGTNSGHWKGKHFFLRGRYDTKILIALTQKILPIKIPNI